MIGAGYVGLVSAACFSEFGWNVTCTDKDADKIEQLRRGSVPVYEPRLEELLERNLRNSRISFSPELALAVGNADLVFLAVGTPMRRGDGHADLSFVFKAVEELAPHLDGFTAIATKSTVPVGTSREQVQTVNSERKIAMAGRVERAAGGSLKRETVAVLGVAFKPDTDDVREAPSLTLIPMLQERGATGRAYDPHAPENAEPLLPRVPWAKNPIQ